MLPYIEHVLNVVS